MPTVTYNPLVDGRVARSSTGSWSTIRSSAGTDTYPTDANGYIPSLDGASSPNYAFHARGILIFDLRKFSGDIDINSLKIRLYVNAKLDNHGLSFNITSVDTAGEATLVAADYDLANYGTTRFLDSDVDITGVSTGAYLELTLNAAGVAYFLANIGGYAKFAIRFDADIDNTSPTYNDGVSGLQVLFNENGSNAPEMVVDFDSDMTSWSGKQKVTVDNTKVSGSVDLTDFPVLIKDSAISSAVYAAMQSGELNDNSALLADGSLEGYFRFESNGNDESSNANNLTPVNTPTYVSSRHGNGVDLEDASSQYLWKDDPTGLDLTGDVALSFFVTPESIAAGRATIVDMSFNGENEADNILFRASSNSSGKLEWFHEYSTGSNEIKESTAVHLFAGVRTHVCLQRDTANKVIKVYVNGRFVENISYTNQATGGSNGDLWIGRNAAGEYFDGVVDDLAIFSRLLSPAEVRTLALGGGDIRFTTDLAGTTEMPFEIVSLDTANETAEIWVKVPTVSYNTDTVFYMWYGNAAAVAHAADGVFGVNNTWRSEYKFVAHLQQEGGIRPDSTNQANHLSDNNTVLSATSIVGRGADFERSNSEHLSKSSPSGVWVNTSQTWSVWFNLESTSLDQTLMALDKLSARGVQIRIASSNVVRVNFIGLSSGGSIDSGTVSGSTQYRMVARYDSVNNLLAVFLNKTKSEQATTGTRNTPSANLTLGADNTGGSDALTNILDGILDEARIFNGALTDAWLDTDYDMINSPGTFLTVADVATTETVQKALQYAILTQGLIQKDLDYSMKPTFDIQKALQYAIIYTVSAITKGLTYNIAPPTLITAALDYYILTSSGIQKDLAYYILLQTTINKSMAYAIITSGLLQKTLEYAILVQTAITKDLDYMVIASNVIQKSMLYHIGVDGYIDNYTPRGTTYDSEYQYTERGNSYTDQYN